jgi:spore coat polysaccharide biosynthesis predicted glycosyltransferase SpsG
MELWIRLDANSQMGFGHLVRMTALATAAVEKGWKVKLFTTSKIDLCLSPHIENNTIDSDEQMLHHSLIHKPDWLFVDGYHFTKQQCEIFNRVATNLAHIDDLQQSYPLNSQLLVSPNGVEYSEFYRKTFPKAKLLCGLPYVLLRPEFQQGYLDYAKRDIAIVSFGGGDVANLSLCAVESLQLAGIADIHLVVTDAMTIDLNSAALAKVTVHQNLPAKEMARLMGKAKIAIAAAGSTMFELASQGVPSVFAIVADNQKKAASQAKATGWCFVFDARECLAKQQLLEKTNGLLASELFNMHNLALQMVDVHGAERIVAAMESISQSVKPLRQG